MSKLEVDKIDPQSGTALEIGSSGDTITIPSGATLDASNATTTLPANVVTTDGTQTLTNKSIAAGSNTVTGLTNSNLSGSAAISNANLANSSITINDTAVSLGGSTSISTGGMYKNIIINGDMSIAQRGTSATGLGNGDSGYHTVDRWQFNESGTPTYEFTMTQDTDVPSGQGFAKSMKLACTTAQASLAADDNLRFVTIIEGQNLQYLKYGTSNAESTTLSFWIKSNKTGDYSIGLYNGDTVDTITKTITINSANTWEKKTLTFIGDTGNAFNNDNGASLYLWMNLLAGTDYITTPADTWSSYTNGRLAYGQTVNLADSTSNYINITGVQLEAGTSASDFEFLPHDVNLQRCFRYCQKLNYQGDFHPARTISSNRIDFSVGIHTRFRATPSLTNGLTDFFLQYNNSASAAFTYASLSIVHSSVDNIGIRNSSTTTTTADRTGVVRPYGDLTFDAEL